MEKPYKNIVSTKESFQTYFILAEYETKEKAMENLEQDYENFRLKYRNTKWFKIEYPCHYATVKDI